MYDLYCPVSFNKFLKPIAAHWLLGSTGGIWLSQGQAWLLRRSILYLSNKAKNRTRISLVILLNHALQYQIYTLYYFLLHIERYSKQQYFIWTNFLIYCCCMSIFCVTIHMYHRHHHSSCVLNVLRPVLGWWQQQQKHTPH